VIETIANINRKNWIGNIMRGVEMLKKVIRGKWKGRELEGEEEQDVW